MNASIDILPCEFRDNGSPEETLSVEDVAPLLSGKVSYLECPESTNDAIAPIVPSKLDILCGRHREAYNHIGNRLFRSVVAKHRTEYQGADSREEKSQITDTIINSIYEGQGRFLKQDDETKLWHIVTRDYAHEKVSHALRSAKDPKEKKRPRKKRATSKEYTVEEDATFVFLLTEQQKIFQGLLDDNFPSGADQMDFALIDEVPSSSIAV